MQSAKADFAPLQPRIHSHRGEPRAPHSAIRTDAPSLTFTVPARIMPSVATHSQRWCTALAGGKKSGA
jgi:hypothetical protein